MATTGPTMNSPSDKNGSAITDARIYHDASEMRIAVRWANDEEIDRPLADFVADALRAEGTPRTAELAMSPLCAAEGCQLCGIDQAEPAPEGTAPESAPSAVPSAEAKWETGKPCPACGGAGVGYTQSHERTRDWQEMLLLRWCEWTGGHINKDEFVSLVHDLVVNNLLQTTTTTPPSATTDNSRRPCETGSGDMAAGAASLVPGETPRTDAEEIHAGSAIYVTADFARQLEHELVVERAKKKRWQRIADQRATEVADLRVALRWCVEHEGECLGDHPDKVRLAQAALSTESATTKRTIEPTIVPHDETHER